MSTRRRMQRELDYPLLVAVIGAVIFGLMMIYSATFTWDDPTYYLRKQVQWAALGFVLLVIASKAGHQLWRKAALVVMGLALLSLLAVLVVGHGASAFSWLLRGGSIQPSEFAKLAFIIYIAAWLASKGDKIRDVTYGLVPFSILLGIVTALVMMQPDIGTAALIVATAVAMFFIAGADVAQLLFTTLAGGAVLAAIIWKSAYARERLEVFLNPTSDPLRAGYHIQTVLDALRAGGVFGRGLGSGTLKLALPLPHTDSIFPVIGEELGLVGCLATIALFVFIAYRGMAISYRAPDTFSSLIAFGVTCWMAFQAFVHVAGNSATLPYTGVTLPFISYGGSSLTMCLAGVGLLLSISRAGKDKELGPSEAFAIRRRDRRPRVSRTGRRTGMEKRTRR
jgi:cell division protein FtsW